jgi:peptide/nickel transport system permease protein
MGRYIVRRVLGALLVLLVVSVLTFGIFMVVPILTGANYAYLYAGKNPNPAQLKSIEEKLGFDKPIPVQYGLYMKGIFTGREFSSGTQTQQCPAPCLGYSFLRHSNVSTLIWEKFPVTASLAGGAAVLWLIFGVSVGVVSALKRGSLLDRAAMGVALAGVSLPIFFTGNMLLLIFSYQLQWFPNVHYVPFTENPYEWAKNLVLPWLSLVTIFAALYARLMRANMLETMGEDYVRTARAKGLPRRKVVAKHGMRAAITPIVTIFGLDLGLLLGGAIITETVFNIPGIGRLSYDAIAGRDLPIIMGTTLFAAAFIVLANIVVDIVYSVVDPRVRLQ